MGDFPRPEEFLTLDGVDLENADDLVAIGGELTVENIIAAYSKGLFPWPSSDQEPVTWWCPNPRWVIDLRSGMKINRTMGKVLRKQSFQVTTDTAFDHVIQECRDKRAPGRHSTWITPKMLAAYTRLHAQGFAHSIEVWRDGELVGGLYGVSLGRAFFGESMFAHQDNASKVAFVALAQQLIRWGFDMLDCQQGTPVSQSFGATPFRRGVFLQRLHNALQADTRQGAWQLDSDLPTP